MSMQQPYPQPPQPPVKKKGRAKWFIGGAAAILLVFVIASPGGDEEPAADPQPAAVSKAPASPAPASTKPAAPKTTKAAPKPKPKPKPEKPEPAKISSVDDLTAAVDATGVNCDYWEPIESTDEDVYVIEQCEDEMLAVVYTDNEVFLPLFISTAAASAPDLVGLAYTTNNTSWLVAGYQDDQIEDIAAALHGETGTLS